MKESMKTHVTITWVREEIIFRLIPQGPLGAPLIVSLTCPQYLSGNHCQQIFGSYAFAFLCSFTIQVYIPK